MLHNGSIFKRFLTSCNMKVVGFSKCLAFSYFKIYYIIQTVHFYHFSEEKRSWSLLKGNDKNFFTGFFYFSQLRTGSSGKSHINILFARSLHCTNTLNDFFNLTHRTGQTQPSFHSNMLSGIDSHFQISVVSIYITYTPARQFY